MPKTQIHREIAAHAAAEAAGVAPPIETVGQVNGAMFITMRRLGRSIAEYAATEPHEAVDAALLEIEDLYRKLDGACVLHNNADPRNAVLDECTGRWYLIDFGKARMREEHDCCSYNTRITFSIMSVRVGRHDRYAPGTVGRRHPPEVVLRNRGLRAGPHNP